MFLCVLVRVYVMCMCMIFAYVRMHALTHSHMPTLTYIEKSENGYISIRKTFVGTDLKLCMHV